MTDENRAQSAPPDEPQDEPQDSTSAWDEPSSTAFDDVLSGSDPLASTLPSLPSTSDPYATPPLPPPPSYPPPAGEPAPATWLPTPEPAPDAAPQDISSTTPEYEARPPLPQPTPPPLPATPPAAPSWEPRSRPRRRRPNRVGVAVVAIVVMLTVVGVLASVVTRRTSTPSASSTPSPPLGQPVPVAASGLSVQAVTDPKRVRLEILAQPGTTASVRYDSDSVGPTKLDTVSLPWAVEASLDPQNSYLSLTGSAGAGQSRGQRPVLVCRVLLDGVLVSESVARGYASCDTSLNRFRITRSTGDGVALAAVTPATPTTMAIPTLPTAASALTFEAYSTASTPTLTTSFGSSGAANKVEVEDQAAPFARRATVPAGADIVSMTASDYDAQPQATLLCRILLDGVPIETTLGAISTSCSTSLKSVLGS